MNVVRTPDGRRLEVDRRIDADPASAWDLLVTPDRWPEWGPSVRAVDCAAARISEGTTGRVRVPGGVWIFFEITACREPTAGRAGRWSWRVAKIPATGHRVEPVSGGCRVVFEIPLVAAGYAPVCSRALDRIASILRSEP
ncbi:SRPBCC family protein [Halovenus sp. WSH3]|uniref:SRPBCC family protein n=1 Tax=Halovenus carboxidivorans TaxID=2692199 RepID=A0A6B0T436_9EURY|nr:SRPBCC family protein [Halovenus carboxidivorans]MXR50042.1 SRPBCC family protein [Halovenus carboxidivorans]